MATTTNSTIGVSRRRVDGESKVRGVTRFVADLPVHGLLHARLVLAAEAHGRITRIDVDGALRVRGVVAVLTADDLPIVEGAGGRAGQPLARSEIVFSGQPVAMVVAETEAAATDGVDEVIVEIEPLEAALDVETAMAPGAALARVDAPAGDACSVLCLPWRRRVRRLGSHGDGATAKARCAARRATRPTSRSTACCTPGWCSRPRRTGGS